MRGTAALLALLGSMVIISVAAWLVPLPAARSSHAAQGNRLVIISPHWDGIKNEFADAFDKWYIARTGRPIGVEWLDVGGSSDCVKYVRSEFKRSPQGIGVDLFFGGGTDPFITLKKERLLAEVNFDSAFLADIPQNRSGIEVYDPDHQWYGAALSGFGIVYNKLVLRRLKFDPPSEWLDLSDPAYFSWVGAADPRRSGTMHLMFEIVLQGYGWERGWEILTGLAANARTFQQGANDVAKLVAKGDMAFGLCIDFYGWAEVAEAGADKIGLVLPRNLTVVSADPIGMLKGAANAPAARLFMEFVLSEDGQKLWYLRKGAPGGPRNQELSRMPVRASFYERFSSLSNITQNPFSQPAQLLFDHRKASGRWAVLNDLAGAALIDRADKLRAMRRRQGGPPAGWAAVPVSERVCDSLAASVWNDPVAKNRVLLSWQEFFAKQGGRGGRE